MSSDIGSMPLRIKREVIESGALKTNSPIPLFNPNDIDYNSFKDEVVKSQIDKLSTGIDVPNYPQFRDMNTMFLQLLTGYEKNSDSYHRIDRIRFTGEEIPETKIIKQESKIIAEKSRFDKFRIKLCITGPYTLSSLFNGGRSIIIEELGNALSRILKESLFNTKYGKVEHVSLDEPTLGFLNDPMLDYGQDGREILRNSWEEILQTASRFGASTSIHLHNTSEEIFWDVNSLDVIGSHINDYLYQSEKTRERLRTTDKKLWVPLTTTQFDNLIEKYHKRKGVKEGFPEIIAESWSDINKGEIDPTIFVESQEEMDYNLKKYIHFFGKDNIAFASPECGLRSFPDYTHGITCLERASNVVRIARRY
ncbi:hypothetical protein GF319_04670 [Candidatus Bathyarchaeota archaeon]|nr:hypothetical protein [Candidatus Bathyarchaeota archaeon]